MSTLAVTAIVSIEILIAQNTRELQVKCTELSRVAGDSSVVRNPAFYMEQLTREVTRIQGILQGLEMARVAMEREVVEVIRTH